MNGSATRSSRAAKPAAAAAVTTGRYKWATCGLIRNSISEVSITANSAMPAMSTPPVLPAPFVSFRAAFSRIFCRAGRFGSRSVPRTRQASDSGMLMVKMVRQPPRPISSPPRVGPMTAMVWLATESAVRTPLGLSRPVRRASLRMRYIAAGYAADVPKPMSTRARISTPRDGARAPSSPAAPTSAVPAR